MSSYSGDFRASTSEVGKATFNRRPAVAFIGNSITIPDANVDLARRALNGVDVRRFDSLADLRRAARDAALDLRLLVIADHRAEDLVLRHGAYRACVPSGLLVFAYETPERALAVLDSPIGTKVSYLPMRCPTDAWISYVRLYCFGQAVVPRELLMLRDAHESDGGDGKGVRSDRSFLTRRERQVLALVTDGLKNRDISERLRLSEHTVKLHLHNTFRKIGVENRAGAAAWYLSNEQDNA